MTGKAFQMSIQNQILLRKMNVSHAVIKLFLFFRNSRLPVCLPTKSEMLFLLFSSPLCLPSFDPSENLHATFPIIVMKESATHLPGNRGRKIYPHTCISHSPFWPCWLNYNTYNLYAEFRTEKEIQSNPWGE